MAGRHRRCPRSAAERHPQPALSRSPQEQRCDPFSESAGLEREGKIVGRLKAQLGFLLEATADDASQRGHITGHRVEIRWIAVQNGAHRIRGRLASEGASAREHFQEHRAKREDIGATVQRLPADLLRRHIADRPHHHSGHRAKARAPSHRQARSRPVSRARSPRYEGHWVAGILRDRGHRSPDGVA